MRRRELLLMLGGSLLAAPFLRADSSIVSQNPLIAEYNLESVSTRYTPAGEFYVRNHFAVPALPPGPQIRIEGEVENPTTFTLLDLARLPKRKLGAVLECSGNSVGPYQLAGNAEWGGWAMAGLLARVRPRPSAAFLHLYGGDGFVRSVPISRARGDAVLATRMNGQPLLPNHGAPWRAFFPGWYGMDSVKWLQRIEVARTPIQPVPNEYWAMIKGANGQVQRRPLPAIQVKSVFVYPAVGAVLRRGKVDVRGLAWSGGAPVLAVEVSADGGKVWRLANVEPASKYEWRFWSATIDLMQPGLVQLACKAIGQLGIEQPASRPPNRLDGYANNVIEKIRVMVL